MARRVEWKIVRSIPISVVALAVPSGAAVAQCANERMEPPGAMVQGKSVSEWTAAYWQWVTAIPIEGGNPFYDPQGVYCNKEQDEAVCDRGGRVELRERVLTIANRPGIKGQEVPSHRAIADWRPSSAGPPAWISGPEPTPTASSPAIASGLDVLHAGRDTFPPSERIRAVAVSRILEDVERL